jgi:hypothetical protein
LNSARILTLLVAALALVPAAWAAAPVASAPAAAASAPRAKRTVAPAAAVLVDINSADAATLKTLPGVGDAEAARIIKGRPYLTKAHLVTHKVLSMEAYQALRTAVVARQAPGTMAALKAKAPAAAASAKKGQP